MYVRIMYVCVYMYDVCVYVCAYVFIYICMYVCMYVYMYICMSKYTYVSMLPSIALVPDKIGTEWLESTQKTLILK